MAWLALAAMIRQLGLNRRPSIFVGKIATARLRVWYRTPGGDPQLESCEVVVKGIGDRHQLEVRLREVLPPFCRLVRWELLDDLRQ